MDTDRLNHSIAVARKMVEIGKQKGLTEDECIKLFLLGYNHDIGYEYSKNGENHKVIGGELLRDSGFELWREVYYHGEITDEYDSEYLDILNQADMQIDKYGNDVGYEKRLDDIRQRYGASSKVYIACANLINHLRESESGKGSHR